MLNVDGVERVDTVVGVERVDGVVEKYSPSSSAQEHVDYVEGVL